MTGSSLDATESQRRSRWPARIAIGRVVKPHGVRGEFALEAWGELASHVRTGVDLELKAANGKSLSLSSVRGAHDRLIGSVEGVTDRDVAEGLRGSVLEIASAELPVPQEDEFYLFELDGCTVVEQRDEGERSLGVVNHVVEDGGGLLLEVAGRDEGKACTYTLPLVSAYLVAADFDAGKLSFRLPEGLLDTCVSTS